MEVNEPRPSRKVGGSPLIIECAQCGERLYVPEWSEFLDGRGVRHLWQCEACHYTFETTVRFAAA